MCAVHVPPLLTSDFYRYRKQLRRHCQWHLLPRLKTLNELALGGMPSAPLGRYAEEGMGAGGGGGDVGSVGGVGGMGGVGGGGGGGFACVEAFDNTVMVRPWTCRGHPWAIIYIPLVSTYLLSYHTSMLLYYNCTTELLAILPQI